MPKSDSHLSVANNHKQQEPHPLLQPFSTLCLGVGSSYFLKKYFLYSESNDYKEENKTL